MQTDEVSDKWTDYKVLSAVGEFDEAEYISLNETTKSKLEGHVKGIETFTIKGESHIISSAYDIDKISSKYSTRII